MQPGSYPPQTPRSSVAGLTLDTVLPVVRALDVNVRRTHGYVFRHLDDSQKEIGQ